MTFTQPTPHLEPWEARNLVNRNEQRRRAIAKQRTGRVSISTGKAAVGEALAGKVPPSTERPPRQSSDLDQPARAFQVGDPIPVVFARYRSTTNQGGILIFPKATECAFSNTATTITSRFHYVISQGVVGPIQTKYVRVGNCRRGTFSANYGKRAGTWAPGNTLTTQSGYQLPNATQVCGIGGNYSDLSTFEISNDVPGGSDEWNIGANIFITDGMRIDRGRFVDGVVGASDNFADLFYWALTKNGVLERMIDTPSFEKAALFCEANGFFINAEFRTAQNLEDWAVEYARFFLLKITRINGKIALRPMLPTRSDGTIDTDPIRSPEWTFDERHIVEPLSSNFQRNYSSFDRRQDPHLVIQWRQQAPEQIPIRRTLVMKPSGTRLPPESIDLYEFCATEQHAVKVAAFLRAQRYLVRWTGTLSLRPGGQTGNMLEGDTIQVFATQRNQVESNSTISEFARVEAISVGDGTEELSISQWPVDEGGRSLIAMEVAAATPGGSLLPWPPLGSCDLPGRAADTTVPAATTSGVSFSAGGSGIATGPGVGTGSGTPGTFDGPGNRPPDNKRQRPPRQPVGTVPPPGGPPMGGGRPDGGPPRIPSAPDDSVFCPGGLTYYSWRCFGWQPNDTLFKFGVKPLIIGGGGIMTAIPTLIRVPGGPDGRYTPWEDGLGSTVQIPGAKIISRYELRWVGANGESESQFIYGWGDSPVVHIVVNCDDVPEPPDKPV